MTKREFLEKLRTALGNDLSGAVIQENVLYYDSYINEEMQKGRTEEDILNELGDPWVLARTIIESVQENRDGGTGGRTYGDGAWDSYGYEPGPEGRDQQGQTGHMYMLHLDTWWKKLLLVLAVIGIVAVVLTVIGGIISLLLPMIVPLALIIAIFALLNNRRR